MMKKDPDFFGAWMFQYLFLHFLEQLNAEQQIELSVYYFDRGLFTNSVAKRVVTVLGKIEQAENDPKTKKLREMLRSLTVQLEGKYSDNAVESLPKKIKTEKSSDTESSSNVALTAELGLFAAEPKQKKAKPADENNSQELYEKALSQVATDPINATKLLYQAAEQGYSEAQNKLGLCYAKGIGVEINMAEAVKWLRKASTQGHVAARKNLNTLYLKKMAIYDPLLVEDYFRDALELECHNASHYLKRAANENNPKILLGLHFLLKLDYCANCKENPSRAFEILKKDPDFFGELNYPHAILIKGQYQMTPQRKLLLY